MFAITDTIGFTKSSEEPHYAPGDKLFVDYCGLTVPVTDPATGEVTKAQIFVACLGASNYTFAEATPSQSLPHWIGFHQCKMTLASAPE